MVLFIVLWSDILSEHSELIKELQEIHNKSQCFPPWNEVFRAFDLCPFEETKLVLLGQDPQHNGEANGLAFSGRTKITPSLNNLYNELKRTHGTKPTACDLEAWARQGVLLLNTSLSVEKGRPNSHQGIGWETITSNALLALRQREDEGGAPVVWVALGKHAKAFYKEIGVYRGSGYHVVQAAHPSPLSRGDVIGSDLFKRIDRKLAKLGHEPINWLKA